MNIKLESRLPAGRLKDVISGVYKITFDNGMLYLGHSVHLRRRFKIWRDAFSGKKNNRKNIWPSVSEKISGCETAYFEAVEYFTGDVDKMSRKETDWLCKYYKDDNLINAILHPRNPIIQYSLDGVEIKRFPSIQGAAKELGVYQRRLQDALNGKTQTLRGFVYRYENMEAAKRTLVKKPQAYKVLRFTLDGELIDKFPSTKAAAIASGVAEKGVYSVLVGLQRQSGGYMFKRE